MLNDKIEKQYYKLALFDRKLKESIVEKHFKDNSLNINSILCQKGLKADHFDFEQIYSKYVESQYDIICLYNFEILFRPEYRFDLLSFIKEKSKTQKIAIIWPGEIQKDQVIYSRPGRPDYYTHKIDNYLVYKDE
ncbi:MAG: hypothetical protein B6241_08635 [Spirochaetaceae bacterium 4572_59]|nr:MAG: hypothetical protein B6241_08635 [Spirochaetaceae bacterium 4572_59]